MSDPRLMYELLEPRVLYGMLGEQTRYLNLGYWKQDPGSWEGAARALAILLGEAAGLGPEHVVLDAGFGYGDQDLLWMEQFSPARIVGVNVTQRQVAAARSLVSKGQLADRIDLRLGSAVATPFPRSSFDRVLALESAMHFETRERFFHEAYRLLRPGGRLALADIILMPGATTDPAAPARAVADSVVGGCPVQNLYDRNGYAERLSNAGFSDVRVESIRHEVLDGLLDHVFRRSEKMIRRWNPWYGLVPGMGVGLDVARACSAAFWARYDYVIASADKP